MKLLLIWSYEFKSTSKHKCSLGFIALCIWYSYIFFPSRTWLSIVNEEDEMNENFTSVSSYEIWEYRELLFPNRDSNFLFLVYFAYFAVCLKKTNTNEIQMFWHMNTETMYNTIADVIDYWLYWLYFLYAADAYSYCDLFSSKISFALTLTNQKIYKIV